MKQRNLLAVNVHLCCVTAWRGLPPTSAQTLPRQLWPLITSHSVATMANYGQLWRKLWPLISHHLAHCCTIFQRSISERSSCWATMASHHLPALILSFSGQFPLCSFFFGKDFLSTQKPVAPMFGLSSIRTSCIFPLFPSQLG